MFIMAYTDTTLTNTTPVKLVHVKEMIDAVNTLITNAKLTSTISTITVQSGAIKSANILSLQNAINKLETSFSNNCCQANHCQTCQSDKCQSCQGCQNACSCQSCQSNKCQSCQSIPQCNCRHCNCDCGDTSE